jgi:hypothetical protein
VRGGGAIVAGVNTELAEVVDVLVEDIEMVIFSLNICS